MATTFQVKVNPLSVGGFPNPKISATLSGGSGGGGSGTVTSVGVTTANGVSASGGPITTSGNFTFSLGAIAPTTVNGNTFTTGTGTLTLGSATLNAGAGGTLGSNAFTSTTFATDSLAAHLAGTETITGNKTFSGSTAFTGSVSGINILSVEDGSDPSKILDFNISAFSSPSTKTLLFDNNGAVDPTSGGTGVVSATAYAPLFGGTTSTGPFQSGTVGTTGQVLTSNGAGALPTFQAAAAGGVPSIAGTTGQIVESGSPGATTLSLPTAITGVNSITAAASTDFTATAGSGNQNVDLVSTGTGGVSVRDNGNAVGVSTANLYLGSDTTTGWWRGSNQWHWATGGSAYFGLYNSVIRIGGGLPLNFSSGGENANTNPAGIAYLGAAQLAIGNGGATDFSGTLKLTHLNIASGGSTTIGVGVGTVNMSTSNSAANIVWIPIQYAGTTYYVPAWTTNAP